MDNMKLEFFRMATELVAPHVDKWAEASEKNPQNVPRDALPSFRLLEKRGQENVASIVADVAEALRTRFAQKQQS